MPAYSYQQHFVPMILDGSKPHTVRAERKGRSRHVLPGETFTLYTGLRTKNCRKIGEATCWMTREITISRKGIIFGKFSYTKDVYFGHKMRISEKECNEFAWSDGFRPEGSTLENPRTAWCQMVEWFEQNQGLPFQGVVIYWKDFIPSE